MRLKDLCEFKTDFPEADFWLVRKGDISTVGKPTKEFNPENIGVKVIREDILNSDYLFYVFIYLQQSGQLSSLAEGSLNLKHIKISDIKNISVG